jgi:DNA-binding GntR family transcriptional regulator
MHTTKAVPKTLRPTGSERVYHELRRRILSVQLLPGSEIDEAGLAAEFGVSRTPFREALIRLAAEELVVLTPNRSAKVPVLDFIEVGELFDALEVTQRIVARWAALRRTSEDIETLKRAARAYADSAERRDFEGMRDANFQYHKGLGDACGNRYYQKLNEKLLLRSLRLAQLSISRAPTAEPAYKAYFEEVNVEHGRLVELLQLRNGDAAEEIIRDHIRQFRARSLDALRMNFAEHILL